MYEKPAWLPPHITQLTGATSGDPIYLFNHQVDAIMLMDEYTKICAGQSILKVSESPEVVIKRMSGIFEE